MKGYIVPKEKPQQCTCCSFFDRDYRDCKLQKTEYSNFDKQYRHCPLIAVELEIYPPVDIAAAETEAVIPLEMMDKLLRGEK